MIDYLMLLRNVNIERSDLLELVGLHVAATAVRDRYLQFAVEPPEWLPDTIAGLDRAIQSRRRDNLAAALKRAEARRETLKSADEKRVETEKEIQRLRTELGLGSAVSPEAVKPS